MLLSIVLALGTVWMSARSKVIPYIVEVDNLKATRSRSRSAHLLDHARDRRAHEAIRDRGNARSVCCSEDHRKGFQFPANRIQGQPKGFERKCSEQCTIAWFSEDHVGPALLPFIPEERDSLAPLDLAAVRQPELFFRAQRFDSELPQTEAGTTE
jgi:hypothetical protein